MTEPAQSAPGEKSFGEALGELDRIVAELEGGQLELEESLSRYERGVALLRALQAQLADAQQKVTMLMGELETDEDESGGASSSGSEAEGNAASQGAPGVAEEEVPF